MGGGCQKTEGRRASATLLSCRCARCSGVSAPPPVSTCSGEARVGCWLALLSRLFGGWGCWDTWWSDAVLSRLWCALVRRCVAECMECSGEMPAEKECVGLRARGALMRLLGRGIWCSELVRCTGWSTDGLCGGSWRAPFCMGMHKIKNE